MIKKLLISLALALVVILAIASPALAIPEPDSSPQIDDIWCYQNILETGDMIIIMVEDTPYAETPDMLYNEAFIWRLFEADGTTEIDQAVGYPYNDDGYNYNVISWYFSASDNVTWGENYYIKLSGTPMAFDDPLEYNFQISDDSYLTPVLVKTAISNLIITIAEDLNLEWDLSPDNALIVSGETGSLLSSKGETFFRGAIYGLQSIAPYAFAYNTGDIDNTWRDWDDEYSANLSTQFDDNYIGEAMAAGSDTLGVDYNLFGLLGLMAGCGVLMGSCIVVGGDVWGSLIITSGVAVIGSRLTLVGQGELGFVVALCWFFTAGKIWKVF